MLTCKSYSDIVVHTMDFDTVIKIMEFSADWFMWIDNEGEIVYISSGVTDITGYTPEEFLYKNNLLKQILDPRDGENYPEIFSFEYSDKKNQPIEFRIIHKDGSMRWIEQRFQRAFDQHQFPAGWWIVNRDVTSGKTMFRNLLRMTQIVDQSAEAIAITDPSGEIEYVNSAFEEITGYSLEDAKKYNLPTFIIKTDRKEPFAYLKKVLDEKGIWRGQNTFHKKDGSTFYLDSVVFPLKDEGGKITNYVKISRDITDLKKTEDDLKESESKNRAILNLQPDLIFIQKKDGTYLDYYTSNKENLYVPPDRFLGKRMEDVLPGDRVKQFLLHAEKAFRTGGVELYDYTLLVRNQTKHYEARIIPFGEDRVLSIIRDVTEKKLREQEQLKYRKLESVGLLAGGIAHDFNNILTSVLGNIELAKLEFETDHTAYKYLERAQRGLHRATGLTKQLLTFARGGEPVLGIVDLKKLVEETVSFNLSGSNVKAVFNLPDALLKIKADRGQIEQVFSNLTINAKQAMPEGGMLQIEARNVPDGYVEILVRDEGTGIPEEYINKIFDPYFSTKQTGSGLGLTTVYSIINKHNGHIHVVSGPEKGTVFTIRLPAVKTDSVLVQKNETEVGFSIGNKHMLVMDDEEMVRSVMSSLIKALGCSADCVSNGAEAIKKYHKALKDQKPYDLVFMDLTIPGGMGGKETMEKLIALDPGVKAVVTSGYSSDPVMAHFTDYGFSGCLVKPFTLDSLKSILDHLFS